MTVASNTNRVSYAGNGVTTAFAFAFPYRASTDFDVTLRTDATGVEVAQALTTNYTIAGAANAGTGGFDSMTLTMIVAPPTGSTLVINRKVPLTTAVDAQPGASLSAPNLEGAIDRAMLAMQQLQEQIGRALLLPKSSPLSNLALPEPTATVASDLLGINATGDGFALYDPSTLSAGQVVSSYIATLLDDANAGAAQTTLGISAFVKTLLDDAAAVNFLATLGFKSGTATIDFANVADNASSAASNVTVTGAAVGDFVLDVTAAGNIATTDGIFLLGKVTAADTVEVTLHNDSAGAFDAASQAIYVVVAPKALFGL